MLFLFVKIKSLPSAKWCSSSLFAHFVPRKLDRYSSRDWIWPLSLKNRNSDSCVYVFYGWQLDIYYLSWVHFLHKRELRKFQVSVVQWWLRKEPNGLTCYADFVFLLIKLIAFLGSSLSIRCRRRCLMRLIIGQNVSYVMPEIIWSLSKDDSKLHTSTGSEAFSL